MSTLALTAPVSSFWIGSISLIWPTRAPPIRTSLPGTIAAALGSSAESL